MLVIAGHVCIDPEKRSEASAAASEVMIATREERGCISYTFSADLGDASLFNVFEEWESQEALDAHFQTPHPVSLHRMGRHGDDGQIRAFKFASNDTWSIVPIHLRHLHVH